MSDHGSPRLLLALALLVAPAAADAESLSGKVVAVADGDTLTVLAGGTPVKIRLHGVDAPEKDQASGEAARRFTTALVLGKEVRVEVVTRDKYGRTVGTVFLGSRCLNDELVRAGLAWWYRQYAPRDRKLALLEEEARRARRGLWAEANPTPPWDFRHPELLCASDAECFVLPTVCPGCPCATTPPRVGNRAALRRIEGLQARVRCAAPRCPACPSPPVRTETPACVQGRCTLVAGRPAASPGPRPAPFAKPNAPAAPASGPLRGNVRTKTLHAPGCRDHGCKHCTAVFAREDEAKRAGYRPHGCVAPFTTCLARCLARNQARAVSAAAIAADCERSCATR